jgi:hypothetical protein
MTQFETLTDALTDLRERGYVYNFNLAGDQLECKELDLTLHPEQFAISEYYRFEGMTDPADNSVVYAIESDTGTKGVMVNAYGVYADSLSGDMINKLRTVSAI